MDVYKISIKLFTTTDLGDSALVPVFHRWIADHVLDDHLLIDVADYAHVHHGPGTLLVSSEANIHLDRTGGRSGLLYFRKAPVAGTFGERVRKVFLSAVAVASKLLDEPALQGKLTFDTRQIELRFNDRLAAPNTPATFAAMKGDLEAFAAELFGSNGVSVTHVDDPQGVLQVYITGPADARADSWQSRFTPVAV